MPDVHEEHVLELQGRISSRLDEVAPLIPGREGYDQAVRAVLDATQELIDYEARVPALRDEPIRALSLLIVRWVGRLAIALAAVLLLFCLLPGWVAWWWLPVLAGILAAGLRLQFMPIEPTGGRHVGQRRGAIVLAAGVLLLLPGPLGWISGWFLVGSILLGIALLVVGSGYLSRPDSSPSPLAAVRNRFGPR